MVDKQAIKIYIYYMNEYDRKVEIDKMQILYDSACKDVIEQIGVNKV
jgi:hypothetical protein